MTIFFDGVGTKQYKYEIEGIAKLFFPVTHFNFLSENDESLIGDYIKVSSQTLKQNLTAVKINVEVLLCEEKVSNEKLLLKEPFEVERNLCILLFDILRDLTKIEPQWGILTGVRPVKMIQDKRKENKSDKEIYKLLHEKYLVSENKLNLAFLTADTQIDLLKDNSQKTYSLYISIPFCKTRCSYCSFVSATINSKKSLLKVQPYIDLLCEEIKQTAIIASSLNFILESIYIGGGTPTAITADQLEQVMDAIKQNFDINNAKEYTVEAGRADTITIEKLLVMKKMGADRISVNPQTFNDNVLKLIGRNHTAKQAIDCFLMAKEIGFKCINMDLIAGLPSDDFESFKHSIDTAIKLSPTNITVHTLSIKRSADLFSQEILVDQNDVVKQVEYAKQALIKASYLPYYLYRQKNTVGNLENVGYAKTGFESLYNIKIMDETQTILACGAGGATKLCNVETEPSIRRIFNYKYHYEYIDNFQEILKRKQGVCNLYDKQYKNWYKKP